MGQGVDKAPNPAYFHRVLALWIGFQIGLKIFLCKGELNPMLGCLKVRDDPFMITQALKDFNLMLQGLLVYVIHVFHILAVWEVPRLILLCFLNSTAFPQLKNYPCHAISNYWETRIRIVYLRGIGILAL
ncbi:hypothetical protein BDW42DRAFT_163979 [Aspergillus taichungensis]|uniref:Uncharacterized protein n=1 Tax=Aspergillus taichungensis TaxID=482145 RepID=A0A2J5I2D8_9EURO|nr:hypothetical protein BDW42DRAFT_163979 [Aspergillus taichungensis]